MMRSILMAAAAVLAISAAMPAQAAWHGRHHHYRHHNWYNSYAYTPYRHRHCWNERRWGWGGWHWVRRCSW